MKAKGKELIFISWIKRDGKCLVDVSNVNMSHLYDREFNINCLSMTNELFIASEFNSYIVKLK